MLSATDFLPARMIEFMNFETTRFPYFGSGLISRFSALWRLDMGSVLGLLFDLLYSCRSSGSPATYAKRPNHLGRFAPYLERRCLRFFTPCVSSPARRMW